jgi:hypothetical protein
VLKHAGDTTTVLPKTLDFSRLSEFLVATGVQVRLAGVVVVDLGGEEFQHAPSSLWRRCEKRRGLQLGSGGEDVTFRIKWRTSVNSIWRTLQVWTNWQDSPKRPGNWRLIASA